MPRRPRPPARLLRGDDSEEGAVFLRRWLAGYDKASQLHGHLSWHLALVRAGPRPPGERVDALRRAHPAETPTLGPHHAVRLVSLPLALRLWDKERRDRGMGRAAGSSRAGPSSAECGFADAHVVMACGPTAIARAPRRGSTSCAAWSGWAQPAGSSAGGLAEANGGLRARATTHGRPPPRAVAGRAGARGRQPRAARRFRGDAAWSLSPPRAERGGRAAFPRAPRPPRPSGRDPSTFTPA